LAVDPIPAHIEEANRNITQAGLQARVTASVGLIESLPAEDASVDYIWCRDVLNHVDLPSGLRECTRVLKPAGQMFIYVTLGTERCEPLEAGRLYAALSNLPENMSPDYFERSAREAGFDIIDKQLIDSEWRENAIERGSTDLLEALLRIARMRRNEAELVRRFGREFYEASYGGDLWGIYQMLGKLCPTVYVLRKL
jgi:SAM-dependent methyltransferase